MHLNRFLKHKNILIFVNYYWTILFNFNKTIFPVFPKNKCKIFKQFHCSTVTFLYTYLHIYTYLQII
ncbi:unnamed protein product [Meloidogyne enterolobii]|uniref:Uncharacterized protein n=1 Tax=Meloidogyne enterolobii TaxID=390850 RepID=A0ACB1A284_MELEN